MSERRTCRHVRTELTHAIAKGVGVHVEQTDRSTILGMPMVMSVRHTERFAASALSVNRVERHFG